METIGAYEAKTHFSQLLERVASGVIITITKHGMPVATLKPVEPAKKRPAHQVIDDLKKFRQGQHIDGLSIREMIDEGRR